LGVITLRRKAKMDPVDEFDRWQEKGISLLRQGQALRKDLKDHIDRIDQQIFAINSCLEGPVRTIKCTKENLVRAMNFVLSRRNLSLKNK
jgi:hypothetical protein